MRYAVRVFFLSLLVFVFGFLFIKAPVFAQSTGYALPNTQTQYFAPNTNSDVPNNLHTWTQNVVLEVMSALSCQLAGFSPIDPSQKCLGLDKQTGRIGFVQNGGGAVGFMGGMIAMLYTPPVHTLDYIRYLSSNFGVAKSAYAQGVGLSSLSPLVALWAVFRNIVYLLLVLVFVLIGLGIMLRVRIDPRTVMTIQNQIPKIIIGLVLITFSLAIAGFLIDLMWMLIIIIVQTLNSVDPQILGGVVNNSSYVTTFSMSNVVGGILGIARDTAGVIGGGIYNTFNANTVSPLIQLPSTPGCAPLDIGCWLGSIIGATIGAVVTAVLGIVVGFIVGIFVFFVVTIALIWALFKIWFALLNAYISILIDIVFAPFWIVGGLLPGAGQGIGVSAWLRDLAGNLMAFPVTIALFLIGRVFIDGFGGAGGNSLFVPPLIGSPQGSAFGSVIAFGIIMMLPNVVKMTKAAFKAPSLEMGPVGQGIGVGQAAAAAGLGYFWRGMTRPGDYASAGPLRRFTARVVAGGRIPELYVREQQLMGQQKTLRQQIGSIRYRVGSNIASAPKEPQVKSDTSHSAPGA